MAPRRLLALPVTVVVLGAALASGAAAEPKPSSRDGRGVEAGSFFEEPVRLQSYGPLRTLLGREQSSEPVIEVDERGTVFVAGASGVPNASPVWRSTDGRRFVELETPAHAREWTVGAEGDIAVDDEGHVYFVETYVAGLLLTRWSDHGETWDFTIPVAAAGRAEFYDRPWLVWTDGVLYLYVNLGLEVRVYRSDDEGLTWLRGSPLEWEGSADNQPYFPGHLSAARADSVLVAGWVGGEESVGLGAAYSTDGGSTFETSLIAPWPEGKAGISPYFPITALDERGGGHVVWSQWDASGCRVLHTVTFDEGRSWSRPRRISRGRGCATFPAVSALGDRVAVAWYGTSFQGDVHVEGGPSRALLQSPFGHVRAAAVDPYQDQLPARARWHVYAAMLGPDGAPLPPGPGLKASREPILQGAMGRALLDFFDVELGNDRRIHVAFAAERRPEGVSSMYVRSLPLQLGATHPRKEQP